MADTTVTTMNDLVTTAYDLAAYPALRQQQTFEQLATVRSTNQSHEGATVQFTFVGDLAAATTPLNESTDLTAVALSSDPLNVTLVEQGNTVTTTAKLRGTSFIAVDPIAAERVGYNAGLTTDVLARTALVAGTNSKNIDITANSGTTAYLLSDEVRTASASLKASDVMEFDSGGYVLVIHPHQEFDLRAESDAAGWRYWQANAGVSDGIVNGVVAQYEGFRVVVSTRVVKTGSGATTSYRAMAIGKEALAKGFSNAPGFGPNPSIVVADPIDSLKRLNRIGWYHLVGYSVFRQEALVQILTEASIN